MAIQPADTHTVNPTNMFTSSPNSAAGVPAADIGSADKTSIKKEPQSPSASRKASVASQKRTTTSAAVLSRKDDPEKRASHNAIERARRESLNSRFLILAASLPAISQIRRPSKSLIVNRSLQFVADSLSREVLYRDTIAHMHAHNRSLIEELNAYKARAGQNELCEPIPPVDPALPRALTDVEKDRASSRPKNGIQSGALPHGAAASVANDNLARAAARAAEAAAAAINAAAAHGMDDYEDFECEGAEEGSANGSAVGSFPLPAGGMEGLQLGNNGNGVFSPATFDGGLGQFLQSAQYYLNGHDGAAAVAAAAAAAAATHNMNGVPAFVAPAHLNGSMAASGSPSSGSPPELSSSASSAGGVSSPLSVSSVTSQQFDQHAAQQQQQQQQQQHYPPLSAAALAAAAAAYGGKAPHAHMHMHARSMTAPAGTTTPTTAAHEIASIYAAAAAQHAQAQQNGNSVPSPHTPTTPMPIPGHGAHGHGAHAHFDMTAAYLHQQQQHAFAAAHAAAAQAIAAQQQHHQQQHGQHGHVLQQQHYFAPQHHHTAPQHHAAGPLPSPFLAAPAHYIASV